MDDKCFKCLIKYGELCPEECNSTCEDAKALNKLKKYGGIDEFVKVVSGNRFPTVFTDEVYKNEMAKS